MQCDQSRKIGLASAHPSARDLEDELLDMMRDQTKKKNRATKKSSKQTSHEK
jgi:hypothetical protein